MNVILNFNDFKPNYIHFISPIKNKLISNSFFYKMFYASPLFILNSLYFELFFDNITLNNVDNKQTISFNVNKCNNIIRQVQNIENFVLSKIPLNKKRIFNCTNQIKKGVININSDIVIKDVTRVYIKISGVWESNVEYGMSFKFVYI